MENDDLSKTLKENSHAYQISLTVNRNLERFEKKLDSLDLKSEQILVQNQDNKVRIEFFSKWSEETKNIIDVLARSADKAEKEIALLRQAISSGEKNLNDKHSADVTSVKRLVALLGFIAFAFVGMGYTLVEMKIRDDNSKEQIQIERNVISQISEQIDTSVDKALQNRIQSVTQ